MTDVLSTIPGWAINKAMQAFGVEAPEKIRANPYCLHQFGVKLAIVDGVAKKLGVATEGNVHRSIAIAEGELERQVLSGHCYVHTHTLAVKAGCTKAQLGGDGTIVVEGEKATLRRIHAAETFIAEALNAPIDAWAFSTTAESLPTAPSSVIFDGEDLQFDSQQAVAYALIACSTAPLGIITGAPGTGKTTCARAALRALELDRQRFALCAPTGKAAQRFAQVTGYPAQTIHRLLEWRGTFQRNQLNPLDVDVVLVDESSMIDLLLAADLVAAIDFTRTRLILIGDADQLPPVGPGSFFLDLIDSQRVPVVKLETLHRSAEGSWIYRNASKIIAGGKVELEDCVDFEWMQITSSEAFAIAGIVADALKALVDPAGSNWARDDIQVMSPQKNKDGGVHQLNRELKIALNANKGLSAHINEGEDTQTVHVGDRVIQTKNNYELGVFNGETGEIDAIMSPSLIRVRFGKEYRTYKGAALKQLMLAYACTVHRMQGSEAPVAVVVCHSIHGIMLNRRLFYTAVTRARKRVIIVGDERGVKQALSTKVDLTRRTQLVRRLRDVAA